MKSCLDCANNNAIDIAKSAIDDVRNGRKEKINAIWLETSGCFGEVISLLNAINPDVLFLLEQFVNMQFYGSIQGDQGEKAYKRILDTLNTEFVFIVSGAIPLNSKGAYTSVATYNGKRITAMEAVETIAKRAKYIINVGTCACYGGVTAAAPNLSGAISVSEFLKRNDIIKIPGCPANPVWVMGVLGYLTSRGTMELDSQGRPTAYFGELIHDKCPRRRFFDAGIFAKKFGDKECMFRLGCKGPITYAYCPESRWNDSENWPIGDNTPCIGCAGPGFPDKTEPFANYGGNS